MWELSVDSFVHCYGCEACEGYFYEISTVNIVSRLISVAPLNLLMFWIIFYCWFDFFRIFFPLDIHIEHDNSSLFFKEAYAQKQKMWNMKNFSFVFIKLWNETWNSNFAIVLWFKHIESSAKSFSFLFYDCSSRFLLWQKSHHWKLKWNSEFSAS